MKVLDVVKTSCQDCHRCLRSCEVGAIGFDEQAWIIEDKCIYCGTCVNVCPQDSKKPYNMKDKLLEYINSDEQVIVSLAPSYLTAYEEIEWDNIIGTLRELGVDIITETAQAAEIVADNFNQMIKERDKTLISSCCPSIINLVEKHFPEMRDYLADIMSPMNLHASLLKEKYGQESKVVFLGPCIAKLDEIDNDRTDSKVDAVITFYQFKELCDEHDIDLKKYSDNKLEEGCGKITGTYPLEDGALRASDLLSDFNKNEVISSNGVRNSKQILKDLKAGKINPRFIELMACEGGCINGPGVKNYESTVSKEIKVNRYAEKKEAEFNSESLLKYLDKVDYKRNYKNRKQDYEKPTEAEIRDILKDIGKESPADETNCGGCGYETCREKAIAVYQGLAQKKMCVPYMKSKAESLSHIIVESSHNAIIVVDKEMVIQEFNPVANQMFGKTKKAESGKKLAEYIDPKLFEKVWQTKQSIVHKKVEYDEYELITEQTIFPIEEYGVIVGIFSDITEREQQKKRVQEMKELAAEKAEDVVHQQMQIVQEIAGLLGETTVETKSALHELTQLMQEEK
jgi:PAS domain S-box-containing protein